MKINNVEELKQHPEYKEALVELLYQLADDDFLISFRGSEWLGLCPHIEEDVAYSSINQNTMGHATLYYELLEELGEGKADVLAHDRPIEQRRNAILLEEPNGPGTYLVEPRYDWAFTVVRNYFYDVAKQIRLESLKNSSYEPLAQGARSILGEQYYHVMHWDVWFRQLLSSTPEARERLEGQIDRVWNNFGNVLSLGRQGERMAEFGIIEDEGALKKLWLGKIEAVFKDLDLSLPSAEPQAESGDGRAGEHTENLETAIETLSEVYRLDRVAAW
ncbi:1,2-phenylacetyl-CoA epoxidase subunit PaaC [Desertibacillus haloalkaliphilus]|uniref:1,2-phenylacetyl-CoA epoxidase subunit PaaC n=1 Tax=Desertibacillus haloalkaliphilus TaxID=1328930 RepID=UPI001C261FAF|nr:1,2-phenylacetyl-CoA epoxidase subunit PaaC [Desertibacillus haloalkaliphilus]MBU8906445.1 phenylacetate-CoA oxygenase subunit PaaC [Desertibacillus haloalkaliphilus]